MAKRANNLLAVRRRKAAAEQLVGKPATTPPSKPETGTETVVICSKLPFAYKMQLHHWVEEQEAVGSVLRSYKISQPTGEEFVIRGNAQPGNIIPPPNRFPGGYAMTPGCSRDFFDRWYEEYKDSDMVRNRVVFMQTSEDRAEDQAREQVSVDSGLGPIDPSRITERIGRTRSLTTGQPIEISTFEGSRR